MQDFKLLFRVQIGQPLPSLVLVLVIDYREFYDNTAREGRPSNFDTSAVWGLVKIGGAPPTGRSAVPAGF